MADGFGTFNLGNVLTQAENIKGLRSQNVLREQQISSANALAQRNAQSSVLLQNFLAGNPEALNQLAALNPDLAEQAQGISQSRTGFEQEQQQREINEGTRTALLVLRAKNPATAGRLFAKTFLDELGDVEGFDASNLDDADTLTIARNFIAQFGGRSNIDLGEFGPQEPNITRENQTAVILDAQGNEQRIPFEAREVEGQTLVQTPQGMVPVAEAFPGIIRIEPAITRAETREVEEFALGRKASGEAQTQVRNLSEAVARLEAIQGTFDPEFLTIPEQFKQKSLAFLDRLSPNLLGVETKQRLARFATFGQSTIQNVNQTIKEITGAQLSTEEAKRITRQVPNEDDSPTEFVAKLNNSLGQMRLAIVRAQLALDRGIDPKTMPSTKRGLQDFLIKSLEGASNEEIQRRLAQTFGGITAEQF